MNNQIKSEIQDGVVENIKIEYDYLKSRTAYTLLNSLNTIRACMVEREMFDEWNPQPFRVISEDEIYDYASTTPDPNGYELWGYCVMEKYPDEETNSLLTRNRY